MLKVIYLDADDTIMPNYLASSISDETVEAIRKAREKGIKVRLATGRSNLSSKSIREKIGDGDIYILYNGALAYDSKGNIVYENIIEKDKIEKLVDISKELKIHLNLFYDDMVYFEEDNPRALKYIDHNNEEYELVDLYKIHKTIKAMYMAEHEDLLKVKERVDKIPGIRAVFSKSYYLEILDEKVSKGHTIEELCKIEGIDLKDVAAFGDQWNDYEMLSKVGAGYIMGNAQEDLKAKFDKSMIVDTCENNGVAKKILELIGD